jgi:hypothetical protein
MKKINVGKLAFKKQTIAVLTNQQLEDVAGGCTDDSSGNGLLCPKFYPKTRLTIVM